MALRAHPAGGHIRAIQPLALAAGVIEKCSMDDAGLSQRWRERTVADAAISGLFGGLWGGLFADPVPGAGPAVQGPGPARFAARRSAAPAGPQDVHPAEWHLVAASAARRQADFLNGRVCAHAGLHALGVADAPLLIGPRGQPLWPPGVTGSIAHCEGYCAAVVLRLPAPHLPGPHLPGPHLPGPPTSDPPFLDPPFPRSLGLDIEVPARMDPAFAAHILTPAEARALDALDPALHRDRLALIFCAKEAFYKAQFPLSGQFLGFQEVSVTLSQTGFTVQLERSVAALAEAGARYMGRLATGPGHVIAGLIL